MIPITNFENYLINESGEVFSTSSKQFLKPYTKPDGYKFVSLYKDGKYHKWYVHRLVASTFLENPENKSCVNHKNSDRGDNRLSNLEWCNHSENVIHSYQSETGSNHYKTYKFVKNGQLIEVVDLKRFCKANNLTYEFMIKVNNGYVNKAGYAFKSHKGYSKY